jgi:DNA polymerase
MNSADLATLLRQTCSLLASHLAFGLNSYPATPELHRFIAVRTAFLPRPLPSAAAEQFGPTTAEERQSSLNLQGIAAQLAECRRCARTAVAVPGQGSAEPKLVVVGDCFIGAEPGADMIWGLNEDELFWRMMAAIQLDRESVHVTNLVKCAQSGPLKDSGEAQRNCLFWLEQELRTLRPRLICAMGDTAAHALIGGRQIPLLRLRGKFHPCQLPGLGQFQVAATYHPRFLLQCQEMKTAAWQDLQMIQRLLP